MLVIDQLLEQNELTVRKGQLYVTPLLAQDLREPGSTTSLLVLHF